MAVALFVPPWLLLRLRNRGGALWRRFHRFVLSGLRTRVRVEGAPATGGVLYVANHLSWLDIAVLGSIVDARFIAKAEVRGWGLLGTLSARAGVIFVERTARAGAREQGDIIAGRLAAGDDVLLFGEGTTGDGRAVGRFLTTLFAAAQGARVQPVSLAYVRLGAMPLTRGRLPEVVWLGDAGIGAHALVRASGEWLEAVVRFHESVDPADFASRKALAAHVHTVVANGYRTLRRHHV